MMTAPLTSMQVDLLVESPHGFMDMLHTKYTNLVAENPQSLNKRFTLLLISLHSVWAS